ncbi:MAG: hypothetical protein AB8G96_01215 [Phycisphaerales bacterium]
MHLDRTRRHTIALSSITVAATMVTPAANSAAAAATSTTAAGPAERFYTGDTCWTPEGSPPGLSGRAAIHYSPGDPALAPGPGDRLVFGADGFPPNGTVMFNAYCDDFSRPGNCGAGPTTFGVAACDPLVVHGAFDVRRGSWFFDLDGTWCGPSCSLGDPVCTDACDTALPIDMTLGSLDAASMSGDASVDVLLSSAGGGITLGATRSAHLSGTRGTIAFFGPGIVNLGAVATGSAPAAIGGVDLRSGIDATTTSAAVGTLGSGQLRVRSSVLRGLGSAVLTGGDGDGTSCQITVDDGGAMLDFAGVVLGGGAGAFTELLVDERSRVGITGSPGLELSAGATVITSAFSGTPAADPSPGTVSASHIAWRVGAADDPNPLVAASGLADLTGTVLDVSLETPLAAGDERVLVLAGSVSGSPASATLQAAAGSDVPYLVFAPDALRVAAHRLGDADLNGTVGFTDILQVISQFGPCIGCPEDQDLDGQVAFSDILFVLSEFD